MLPQEEAVIRMRSHTFIREMRQMEGHALEGRSIIRIRVMHRMAAAAKVSRCIILMTEMSSQGERAIPPSYMCMRMTAMRRQSVQYIIQKELYWKPSRRIALNIPRQPMREQREPQPIGIAAWERKALNLNIARSVVFIRPDITATGS